MGEQDLTDPAVNLGARIRARRATLRISQADLAQKARLSDATVRRIESGSTTGMQAGTRAALEHALKWRDGLIDRILDGTATEVELDEVVGRKTAAPAAEPCACVVGSPAWVERELATERRINAIAQVFQGEMQRLLALVEAVHRG